MQDPKPVRAPKPLPVPEDVFWKPGRPCRSCGADIWWWRNPKTGKAVPVNADSTSHFATCNDPKRFSRGDPGQEYNLFWCKSCGGEGKGMSVEDMRRHLAEVHLLKEFTAMRTLVLNVDGRDFFEQRYTWRMAGGVEVSQAIRGRKGKG